jgi:prevent-host-death family protein
MKVYTYSEARQRLASLLDQARREGQVRIRRRDGQMFVLQPVTAPRSPLSGCAE